MSSTCIQVLWLHKEWTRDSTKISIHSLTYPMLVDINPPACCRLCVWWWWEFWKNRDVWNDVGIGGTFSKGCKFCDTLDPVFGSVWWESWSNLGVQCNWIDLCWILWWSMPREIRLISSTSPYRFGVRQYFRFFSSRTILILIVRALLLTSCTHDSDEWARCPR